MYEELVNTLRKTSCFDCDPCDHRNTCEAEGCFIQKAADAIEELNKQRDSAYDRLCGWCGVCPVDRRNVEDCEIAMIGPEYIHPGRGG